MVREQNGMQEESELQLTHKRAPAMLAGRVEQVLAVTVGY